MLPKILLGFLVVQFAVYRASAGPHSAQLHGKQETDRGSRAVAAALAHMISGDPEGAISALRGVATTSPNAFESLRAKCLIGAALALNGEFRSAEDGADILNNPRNGSRAIWKQALPDCVGRLDAIASKIHQDRRPALYYYLGLIGDNEVDHMRYLREAVKMRADFAEAAYQLGVHLLGNGHIDEAISLFRKVSEQKPEWAEARGNIGIALMLSDRPAEAVKELQEAVRVNPAYVDGHGQLGRAMYAIGNYDGAMDECAQAVKTGPDNPAYHNCAAVVLLEKSRDQDALAYARRSAQLAPSHETFQVVLAAALWATGSPEQAISTMRTAIAAHPALRSDPTRLERANLLRGRALMIARQVIQKIASGN